MSAIDSAVQSVLNAKQSAVNSQVAIAVAAKQLDATRQQGQAAVALLESAVQLSKAVGKGLIFDAQS